LSEKSESTYIWKQIEALSKELSLPDTILQRKIMVSCSYGRIKYELIEQMWKIMLEKETNSTINVSLLKKYIARYDELWSEWISLKNSSQYCATLYTDMSFRNKKEGSIGAYINDIKSEISLSDSKH
jgi:hypothetical protein